MARSLVAITPVWPGAVAAALVLLLTLGTLAAVAWRAEWQGGLAAADWAAIRFTVSQALVSAALSVLLAIPVARALARRRFVGRKLLITLLGAPFLLPVIVAVLGLLAVFGRGGILNSALASLGFEPISIFGFHGVVLAHVFFNLPLAIRLILQGWLAIPAERFRLAATLNASVWRMLEWPMLRAVVPSAFLVIFLICLTSFAVALTLGGGPRATTVELAIYQALRFDFDLGRAALLACIQFGLCVLAAFIAWRVSIIDAMGAGLDRVVQRWDLRWPALDYAMIATAALFLLVPLAMVVLRGLPGLTDLPRSIWDAALRSVLVATGSAILCVAMALALSLRGGALVAIIGVLPLAASGLVVGTGAFLIVFPFIRPADVALLVTMLVNATLALPFALRAIAPAVAAVREDFGRLALSLRLTGWAWLRIVVIPRIRRPLGFAAGLAAALSMGDLGVIMLFAGQAQETLPFAMYRLMGAYRMEAAAGAALLLVALSLALFWICDRGGRTDVDL
ncbi:thiamine/thiamine pyrophosphate ABC transporter permease ThiP [Cognatiyoonia sp. IB215446]|uniref:thiamine/thiamine pyrophosphate ABC transporter permease ThiP n=1 Tax=Cognatiyoonia sp. IB215446 TaxID=3097355 RepID=UPI002A0FB707|nr:thiamine/thiamine pyrophosphate ABC transporter permease ThiP [Cognatiyoonia sp. IB215446]MDX8349167.1 thiamine/thiamine pyrophosphate ABC transporter permease ThiP [Cognatiyoonia sp. IB215446]